MADERGPVHSSLHPSVHVEGEVVATKRIGGYRHLTLTAPGVPERFRAGNFVAVTVAGHVARRALWVHRVRASSAFVYEGPLWPTRIIRGLATGRPGAA